MCMTFVGGSGQTIFNSKFFYDDLDSKLKISSQCAEQRAPKSLSLSACQSKPWECPSKENNQMHYNNVM